MSEWALVERAVDRVFAKIYARLEESAARGRLVDYGNIFVHALGGRFSLVMAHAERSIVTILGNHSLLFYEPFLDEYEVARPPFTALARIRGEWYYVRIVPLSNTLNSSKIRELVNAHLAHGSKSLVLTLASRRFEPRVLAKDFQWLDAHTSWYFVTGDPQAYRKFREIVFRVGRSYRARFYELVKNARSVEQF